VLSRLTPCRSRALTLVGESDRKLVKLAMKSAPPEMIKQRTIPPELVKQAADQLDELEKDVEAVMEQEKEEKMVRPFVLCACCEGLRG
jgi:ATP-dependent RNA helicase DDX27